MIHDIKDDEIRIIRPAGAEPARQRPKRTWQKIAAMVLLVVAIAVFVGVLVYFITNDNDENDIETTYIEPVEIIAEPIETISDIEVGKSRAPRIEIEDTIVAGSSLRIYNPIDAIPSLQVGVETLADTTIVLAFQAADIRRDNGGIVGAYVVDGELLSRGKAKAGFCAIIDNKITIGVADTTPLLEAALDRNGYFFRQYPLIVSGHAVENKPRNRSVRRALAEYRGAICVIESQGKLSLNEFAVVLADMGVENAIYLIGSGALGLVKNSDGSISKLGKWNYGSAPNTNFIVWR